MKQYRKETNDAHTHTQKKTLENIYIRQIYEYLIICKHNNQNTRTMKQHIAKGRKKRQKIFQHLL